MTRPEAQQRGPGRAFDRSFRGHAVALLGLLAMAGVRPEAAMAQTSEAPIKRVVPPSDARSEGPAPLLREGGLLLEVPGRIERNAELGVHVFRPEPDRTGGVRRELILLPSRGLEDLARIEEVRSRLDEDPMAGLFELSGRVLVYQGRNFLLPESIVPVAEPAGAVDRPDDAESRPVEPDEDDIADDLEARLEARIGAIPRSIDLAEASSVSTSPIRSGTRFVDRRGSISRDPESGVWRFVPAGSGGGQAGGIVLLPCLELQRIERTARQRDVSSPFLMSGLVTAFRGRNYLLPTSVKVAVEGRGIGP
jgi:hypothetical protein